MTALDPGDDRVAHGARGPTVIAIATSAQERVRLAQAVESAALVLVSSAEEALRLLQSQEAPTTPDAHGRWFSVPGLDVDSDRHVAAYQEREAELTPLEHDLLRCLAGEPGRVWRFGDLHEVVWGTAHLGSADVHSVMKRLRRKLRQLGTPVGIQTVRGVGLRLTGVDDARAGFGGSTLSPVPPSRTDGRADGGQG